MTLSATSQDSQQKHGEASACVSVLLLDTPENLGTDFLQALQRQDLKLVFERVNDKEELYAALRQGGWDILLVCDQVNVPGQDETLPLIDRAPRPGHAPAHRRGGGGRRATQPVHGDRFLGEGGDRAEDAQGADEGARHGKE